MSNNGPNVKLPLVGAILAFSFITYMVLHIIGTHYTYLLCASWILAAGGSGAFAKQLRADAGLKT